MLEEPSNVPVQSRLSPPVAGCHLRARGVPVSRGFEERACGRCIEGGVFNRRKPEPARGDVVSRVVSNEGS